jgi:hypothetical protein
METGFPGIPKVPSTNRKPTTGNTNPRNQKRPELSDTDLNLFWDSLRGP